ncbi:hypothetical protein VTJ83DRAFT_752 [Remersonia thermophila]|uniref:Amino acid transporter n=1 Tax=Remersonia thermophila TaxID=72144 RepID=A0ABR4DLV4_9PEZI
MASTSSAAGAASGERQPLLAASREDAHIDDPNTVGPRPQAAAAQGTFTRSLGTAEAFAVVVSIVIGSGVFTSPGAIDTNVPSPGVALLVWLVGGLLAWTGANTMAELGTAIPGEGGVQPYLTHIFGDVFGFLAAWTWVVAVIPATLAIMVTVFVESAYAAAGATTTDGAPLSHKLIAIAVLVVITAANSVSTRVTTRLNGVFVAAKFTAIALVVLAGVVVVALHSTGRDVGGGDWAGKPWFAARDSINPDGSVTRWDELGLWETLGHLSAALYAALWAYSGWDKAIYISAELSNPARQLPLAFNTALATVLLCFLTANASYYVLLPWDVVSTTDSVAVTAINRLLGPGFGIVAAVLICFVVAGSLISSYFVAGRMIVAAANRGWLPQLLGVVGSIGTAKPRTEASAPNAAVPAEAAPASDAPINALVLTTVATSIYILVGNFRALLTFNGLGEYTFFFLVVLGALVLRWREPELERPYKTSIANPVAFALVSGFVVVRGAVFAPTQTLALLGLWALGLGYYWARTP